MASHHLTIAKASFTASLLRPEAVPLTRDSITEFHTLLDTAVSRCTFSNVQKCKAWVLTTIAPFSARTSAFGKYLVSLAKHLPADDTNTKGSQRGGLGRAAAISRRRLHILYLLNDLLHHTKYHVQGNKEFSILTSSLHPFLADLVTLVSSDVKPKVRRRLESLIEIWRSEHHFAGDFLSKLRSIVDEGANGASAAKTVGDTTSDSPSKDLVNEPPFIMPPTHGDVNTPYYDLPAGNLLPHIIPNSTVPIRPENIRPLQFVAGPADESLVEALKDFMQDVDRIDDEMSYIGKEISNDGLVAEIDELGQVMWKDEKTGDVVKGDTYYGWSREFCEKMKRRRKGVQAPGNGTRSGSRSYSSMSRSRSRSRSPSREDGLRTKRRFTSNPSRSSSYSRSRSPHPNRRRSYTPSEPDIDSRPSFSVNRSSATQQQQQSFVPSSSTPNPGISTIPTQFPPQPRAPPQPPFPIQPFSSTPPFPVPPPPPFPAGVGGPNINMPFPPPRPAGYTGPWPPPPPPPPPNMGFGPGSSAGSPPPPPPSLAGIGMNMNMPMGTNQVSYGQNHSPPQPPPPGNLGASGRGGFRGRGGNRGGWGGR